MRIAIVVPGGVDRGGEERIIPTILWNLERLSRRHDVHVIVPNQEPRAGSWQLRGATVHNIGRRRWRFAAVRLLRRLHAERPIDVFHALWARGPGEVAWAASRLCGRPMIVSANGGEFVWMPALGFGTRRPWTRWLARFVVRHADRVTTPSRSMMELVERAGGSAIRLPLGVDTDLWTPVAPRPRQSGEVARLVHVGSLTPVKDHRTLLEALARMAVDEPVVHLHLVGVDAMDGAVQRLAGQLGVTDRVTFHGYLPPASAVGVVRAAHLMLVSSRHEAGPVAMLEAAAVGVPTVGTDVGLVRDWSPTAAVAVPLGDPDAMAAAISTLLADDRRRVELAERAQARARAEDADWTAQRFEALYEEVLHSAG